MKKLKCKVHPLEYRSLDDCYSKPSALKREIYIDWCEWFAELASNNISDYEYGKMTILSYNCNIFTLCAEVYNKIGELIGYLYITKTRQEFRIF